MALHLTKNLKKKMLAKLLEDKMPVSPTSNTAIRPNCNRRLERSKLTLSRVRNISMYFRIKAMIMSRSLDRQRLLLQNVPLLK